MDEAQQIKKLGLTIRRLREERNLTQVDLASLCDDDKTSINRIEAGRTNPTTKTLIKIAYALNVEIKELFSN